MTDNVTNVDGVPISTDELTTLNGITQTPPKPQAQRVKILYGADGDGTDVSTTSRLPVALSTLPALVAGTANIGDVDVLTLPALPAGANAIGTVGVTSLPALVAGAALVGKVGIDQTTPGTTNRVDIGAALPAGANAIGKLAANSGVNIGTVDLAAMLALVAGTAVIGKVSTNLATPGTTDRVMASNVSCQEVTPTIQSYNTLFTIGDYVGPSGGAAWAITPANRATGLGGQILNIVLIDAEGLLTNADIWIFDNSGVAAAMPAGNAAWSLTDANAKLARDFVSVTDWKSYGNGTMGHASVSYPIPYVCDATTLYFAVVTQNAMTYAGSTPLTLRVGMVWD